MKPITTELQLSIKNLILTFCCTCLTISITGQSIDLFIIGSNGLHGQQVEWTVGEIILRNNDASILTDGFHQGELLVTSTVQLFPQLDIAIYPNPTISSIQVRHDYLRELKYQLVDITGRPVKKGYLNNNEKNIDVSTFEPGQYLLLLFDSYTLLSTSKIVKL